MNIPEYGKLMSNCVVAGGEIILPGISPNQLMEVYNIFVSDLFNMRIPHYRVVGLWHGYDRRKGSSLFRNVEQYECSIIELSRRVKYIVPMELGGNDPAKGCFYGLTEDVSAYADMEDFKAFNRGKGASNNGKGGDHNTANFLLRPSSVIGSLMMDYWNYDDAGDLTDWTTSSMWYTQFQASGITHPRVLIPNKYIAHCESSKDETAAGTVFAFIMRGTGHMHYSETQKLFDYSRCKCIMPCDTKWDLSEFMVVRIPDSGNTTLKLTLMENIDEGVLQTILHEYGRELEQQ